MSTGEPTPEANLLEQDRRVAEFVAAFRELKHHLLNSVAIWMAQAELANRNPALYEKLARSIVDRSETLLELARDAEAKVKTFAPYGSEGGKSRR